VSATAANRDPWPFVGQLAACGLAVDGHGPDRWWFAEPRLFVHVCVAPRCALCARGQATGWRTLTVTTEQVRNGCALDAVAGALWTLPRLLPFDPT